MFSIVIKISGLGSQFPDWEQNPKIAITNPALRSTSRNCDHNSKMVAENLQCSERAEEIKKYFESVSGFDRFRGYTSEEKLVSDDWRQIGPCRPPRKSSRPPESLQKTRWTKPLSR